MRPRAGVAALALLVAVTTEAQNTRRQQSTAAPTLSVADRSDATNRLLSLLQQTDIADGSALYEAQQEGMPLVDAVFRFGSDEQRVVVLEAAAALVHALPTAGALAARDWVSREVASVELLSPIFTRARQRLGRLGFSIDGVPLPKGKARTRRVFPMISASKIEVLSEDEMQFAYLLSTLLRLSAEGGLPRDTNLAARRVAAHRVLLPFLLQDKVRFYWQETPAWHWSGPFPTMRARVVAKLEKGTRTAKPPWFGAIVDHELHLFAAAADLLGAAAADADIARMFSSDDRALLNDVRAQTLAVLHQRVSAGPRHDGFLFDYGVWSTNVSYQYAGCTTVQPIPTTPCPVDSVATDVSHARRWPWWLRSFERAWPSGSREAAEMAAYATRLATQFSREVIIFSDRQRPLTTTYMDGRNGWYNYRDFPGQDWGYGPSSMTGAVRYGSWALLAPRAERIATMHREFCRIAASGDSSDVAFRIRYYGSPSQKPELAGLGETDFYGIGSLYALVCRIDAALGLY